MNYKTTPLKHQESALGRFVDQPYGALFCEMGTGKTKIMLDILGNNDSQDILVAAPNGLHFNWGAIEIPKHFPNEDCEVYTWRGMPTSKVRKQDLKHFIKCEAKYRFLLINVEALRTKNGYGLAENFLASDRNKQFVIDESTCIKNPKAQQTRSVLKLAQMCHKRWILNGTPITQGPLDLFSQCKFLSRDAIPYSTYTAFKHKFAVETTMTMGQRSFNKIIGYQNLEELTKLLEPFSLRLEKKDCLDLPDKTFTTMAVELETEQEQVYKRMKDDCIVEFESGNIVTATMALTKLVKLHQILTGFVMTDDGQAVSLKNNRIKALLQIAETSQPLVIFCAYKQNVLQVEEALSEVYGKDSVVVYSGDTASTNRTEAIRKFQDGEAKFFIGTSAAAKGLTLHRASTMVYYSNNYSLETRLQSQDRIHRIGQNHKCTYIDLVVPQSLDESILKRLLQKKELSSEVLDNLIDLIKN
jgi:SNF2 family DNA or RNA helicase